VGGGLGDKMTGRKIVRLTIAEVAVLTGAFILFKIFNEQIKPGIELLMSFILAFTLIVFAITYRIIAEGEYPPLYAIKG